jgi:membrane protein DedA with SNARE-associated domain
MMSSFMLAVETLFGHISTSITDLLTGLGYTGIFLLMTIESAGIPIPSELIMTFGGYLASTGKINWIMAAVIGTLGTGLGSAIGYGIGAWGGKAVVDRYGGYIGVTPDKMLWAEKWFCKFGESAVFYTRLLPVVRTLVNVPAGLLGMNFYKFMAYTMAGALPWCLVLAFLGYTLGSNWRSIMQYTHLLAYAVGGVVVAIVAGAVILYLLVRQGFVKKETVMRYLRFITHV